DRTDRASRLMRGAAPVAFWLPPLATVAAPAIWADERRDGHAINAQNARAATQALALGFIVSRTTKAIGHRARPCSGEPPDSVFLHPVSDPSRCARERLISAYTSFFSEHTMSAFA